MSFFPDITPLTNEVKQLNHHQQRIITLLEEQNQLLKNQRYYGQRKNN